MAATSGTHDLINETVKRQPLLRIFITPAAICAMIYVCAMVTILQFSMREFIPGSLIPGGLTLANFTALLKPLYGHVLKKPDLLMITFVNLLQDMPATVCSI